MNVRQAMIVRNFENLPVWTWFNMYQSETESGILAAMAKNGQTKKKINIYVCENVYMYFY